MFRAEAWRIHRDARGWRADAIDLHQEATRRFVESMRHEIDVARLYRQALRALTETVDGKGPLPVRHTCDATLDELLPKRVTHAPKAD
jgi:hypothetical protein